MDKSILDKIKQTQARGILRELQDIKAYEMKNTIISLVSNSQNVDAVKDIVAHINNDGQINMFKIYNVETAYKFERFCNAQGVVSIVVEDIKTNGSYFIIKDSDVALLQQIIHTASRPTGFLLES